MVCADSVVSAQGNIRHKIFHMDESRDWMTHEQIKTTLSKKELSPGQVALLVSSYGNNDYKNLNGEWMRMDFKLMNLVSHDTRTRSGLKNYENDCVQLAELKYDSILFKNLNAYCNAIYEKVVDHCKDKMQPDDNQIHY